MTDPRDVPAAFDRIADKVEPLLVRLGRASPGAELETIRDEITALLDGAGLRWSDVAARVAAPSPSKQLAAYVPPPPPPPFVPPRKREDMSNAAEVWMLSNEELKKRYGYRRGPGEGYGYDSAPPDGDAPKLGEV